MFRLSLISAPLIRLPLKCSAIFGLEIDHRLIESQAEEESLRDVEPSNDVKRMKRSRFNYARIRETKNAEESLIATKRSTSWKKNEDFIAKAQRFYKLCSPLWVKERKARDATANPTKLSFHAQFLLSRSFVSFRKLSVFARRSKLENKLENSL